MKAVSQSISIEKNPTLTTGTVTITLTVAHFWLSRSTYFVNTDRSLFSLYRYTGSNKTKLN